MCVCVFGGGRYFHYLPDTEAQVQKWEGQSGSQ